MSKRGRSDFELLKMFGSMREELWIKKLGVDEVEEEQ